MNRQLIKLWLVALLAMVALASCRKDVRTEPQDTPDNPHGEAVTLSLSAEVGFDEEQSNDLKGLDFKLENNADGKAIPRPQFAEGDSVAVHTVIRNEAGTVVVAKTLMWRYEAKRRKLLLKQTAKDNSLAIAGFNNSTKWYIAGLLAPGTTLGGANNTEVKIEGTRELKVMTYSEVVNLNVPYWFGWRELKMETDRGMDGTSSKYAVATDTTGKFEPLGTLIQYKLGNAQTAGIYTFTPSGFTVTSNAWGDKGTFDLKVTTAQPKWTGELTPMVYSFASGHAPGELAHSPTATSVKTYYAWVMPYRYQPSTVTTRVLLKGTSSRSETATYKDYTKTYFTDYTTEGKASGGRLKPGKIQTLTARAVRRVALPIEYVTDYNLAGGEGLTYTIEGVSLASQPDGVRGRLRFANVGRDGNNNIAKAHQNDQSGYYNWYRVMGIADAIYNTPTKNLETERLFDTDNAEITLSSKYFIPELDHWWGVFPADQYAWAGVTSPSESLEIFQLGYHEQESQRLYFCSQRVYSQSFTDPQNGSNASNNAVFYGIRFAKYPDENLEITFAAHFWDTRTRTYKPRTYLPYPDNSLRCAYRYTRVGGASSGINNWGGEASDNTFLGSQLRVDVVYLGDANVSLAHISNQSWWDGTTPATSQRLQMGLGPVITKIFPASGFIAENGTGETGTLKYRGNWAVYWSSSANSPTGAWRAEADVDGVYVKHARDNKDALPVRLFKRNPDQ